MDRSGAGCAQRRAPEGPVRRVALASNLLKAAPVLGHKLGQLVGHLAHVAVVRRRRRGRRAGAGWRARGSGALVSPGRVQAWVPPLAYNVLCVFGSQCAPCVQHLRTQQQNCVDCRLESTSRAVKPSQAGPGVGPVRCRLASCAAPGADAPSASSSLLSAAENTAAGFAARGAALRPNDSRPGAPRLGLEPSENERPLSAIPLARSHRVPYAQLGGALCEILDAATLWGCITA